MSAKKRSITVLVSNDLVTDQRVARVCDYLSKHNFKVTLVGRLRKNSPVLRRPYQTKRFNLFFSKGPLFYAEMNFRYFLFLLNRKSDWILANDLDTLPAAHFARKITKSTLVYDSHEYFCGVPELTSRPRTQTIWRKIEQNILPQINKMYTVNQAIAELYKLEYGIDPVVVRNVSQPLDWEALYPKPWPFQIDKRKVIILQGAGINIDRGAEEAVLAMKLIPRAHLVFIGSGDVFESLKKIVKDENLSEQVHFLGRMEYSRMMGHTVRCFAGLSLDKPSNPNYQNSLPNKIFDYIQAHVPIVGSPLIEVRKIIEEHQVGTIISEVAPEKIAEVINYWLDNPDIHRLLVENCQNTALRLNWDTESQLLNQIYVE